MQALGNVELGSIRKFGCSKPIASFRNMTQPHLSPHISLLALGQRPKPFLMCNGFTGPSPVGCCSLLVLVGVSVSQLLEMSPVLIPVLQLIDLNSNKRISYECHLDVVLKQN